MGQFKSLYILMMKTLTNKNYDKSNYLIFNIISELFFHLLNFEVPRELYTFKNSICLLKSENEHFAFLNTNLKYH